MADAAVFAMPDRVPIDLVLGGLPFEALAVSRSTPFAFEPDCVVRTCSAEDLIVQKLLASRPRDVVDVETVCDRQRGKLDWAYIEEQLQPLAEVKDAPEIMVRMALLRDR